MPRQLPTPSAKRSGPALLSRIVKSLRPLENVASCQNAIAVAPGRCPAAGKGACASSASATGRMIARLVRAGQAEPVAFYYGRTKPKRQRKFDRYAKRWRYGDRGRRPGQMVQIDHLSVSIDTGFSVKEFKAVCPVSKLCCMRANAAGRYEFHQFYAGEPSVGA